MKTRKVKTPKQKIKKKLEKLVKEIVKKRDNYTCQKSGKPVEGVNCHASHVVPVSADGRLAFDPENLKVLSYHYHMNWWHKFPTEAAKWFKEKFPERLESLERKHLENQSKGTIQMSEYEEMEEALKATLTQMDRVADF